MFNNDRGEFVYSIVLLICFHFIILLGIKPYTESERIKIFLEKVDLIHNANKLSMFESPNKKLNRDNLYKVINIDKKDYELDYSQKFIIVKNFKDKFYCNKTFNVRVNDSNRNFILRLKEIKTSCENNNMLIYYSEI